MSDLLESIEAQIKALRDAGNTPAVIKMSPDTWSQLARGVLSGSDLHNMTLFNLRVMLAPEMKTGVARVYQEW